MNPADPAEHDLTEPVRFLALLEELNIPLVNLTAGSPYYNPHIQRPRAFRPRTDTGRPTTRCLKWRGRWMWRAC